MFGLAMISHMAQHSAVVVIAFCAAGSYVKNGQGGGSWIWVLGQVQGLVTIPSCLTGVSLETTGALSAVGFVPNEINLQKAIRVWEERTKKAIWCKWE